jgi:hypothetical protein
MNGINILVAVLVSAVINAAHTFYISSDMFVKTLSRPGESMGRLEVFIEMSRVTEGFWNRIFEGWLTGTMLSMGACIILLTWISYRTKASN